MTARICIACARAVPEGEVLDISGVCGRCFHELGMYSDHLEGRHEESVEGCVFCLDRKIMLEINRRARALGEHDCFDDEGGFHPIDPDRIGEAYP